MNGTLYLIGVGIGNTADMSSQAVEKLKQLKTLACEDKRVTSRLLKDLSIESQKDLVSIFEHNERSRAHTLIEKCLNGHDVGVVSSRGMPLISDPGYVLVRMAVENEIPVKVLSGPSAFLMALVISGLPTDKFLFLGFPPKKPGKQCNFFKVYQDLDVTLIFYESPRRIAKTLKNLESLFKDWHVAVCRELTKTHEQILRGTFSEISEHVQENDLLGEIVVVLSQKK